jgi:hypothetical protein
MGGLALVHLRASQVPTRSRCTRSLENQDRMLSRRQANPGRMLSHAIDSPACTRSRSRRRQPSQEVERASKPLAV